MSSVHYEFAENLATITLSTDRTGALNRAVYLDLERSVHKASQDQARALLLRTHGKVFASGFDIPTFKGMTAPEAHALFADLMRAAQALEDLPIPTLAAVHGQCLGGGLELALACDLVVAREDTLFGQVEVLVGGTTFIGGVYRLAERCGSTRALEIAMTGSLYSAIDFERWNIINSVQTANRFPEHALGLANRLASGPTAAHLVTKQLSRRARVQRLRELDALLLELAPDLVTTQDMQKAIETMMSIGPRAFMADPMAVGFNGK